MTMSVLPVIKDMHGTFDMSDVVAVINRKQWEELCRLAMFNQSLKEWTISLLGNDELFNGGDHEQ